MSRRPLARPAPAGVKAAHARELLALHGTPGEREAYRDLLPAATV